jgi:EF-P beta-lysylation protein EpmB
LETKFNKTTPFIRDSATNWQKMLAQGFNSSEKLLTFLELPLESSLTGIEKQFATRVPLGFANRMQKGNRLDPLLLQVLATEAEGINTANYVADPLSEKSTNLKPGLIHKYQGRVLLTLTGACAVNCRYCFRRHFPYSENNPGRSGWHEVLEYVAKDNSIHEVILSGGDPLLVTDAVFADLVDHIASIPHVQTLRIHTRIPIVLPERITEALLAILSSTRLKKVVVIHCNHAQEIDESVDIACQALRQVGCHLLNQSVLLAGINDNADTLAKLSTRLFQANILPYYLHVLDKVEGAMHFDMPLSKALDLYSQLQAKLPGYLLPRLAREDPGKDSKTLLV